MRAEGAVIGYTDTGHCRNCARKGPLAPRAGPFGTWGVVERARKNGDRSLIFDEWAEASRAIETRGGRRRVGDASERKGEPDAPVRADSMPRDGRRGPPSLRSARSWSSAATRAPKATSTPSSTSRGLTVEEAEAALTTYVPPGEYDPYIIVSSGGHSGNIHLVGVPSMRLLKTIPVFTPESWSGYGQGSDLLRGGPRRGLQRQAGRAAGLGRHPPSGAVRDRRRVRRPLGLHPGPRQRPPGLRRAEGLQDQADRRHPQYPDIARWRLRDAQLRVHPHLLDDARGADRGRLRRARRVRRASSAASRRSWPSGPRVASTWTKSFQIEIPPYTQDLADAGKLGSDGLAFIGSYNSEMATGGVDADGNPDSIEVGASQNDFDFLHVIDWKKAEEVVAAGNTVERNGIDVIDARHRHRRGHPLSRARASQPARRGRRPDRQLRGRRRQARSHGDRSTTSTRSATAMAEPRTSRATDQFGVPILDFDYGHGRPGRGRPGPAAHPVRRQGPRLHQPLPRLRGRQVHAR